MSAADTVSLFSGPLSATKRLRDAVTAAGGVCACTGACGRTHADNHGRCAHGLTGGYRLFLTEAGALLCARCFDSVTAAARKAERANAEAESGSLFDLLTANEGV